jgi:carbamoyl-phosphate synthase large subunit|tara:strand:- start:772 stop:4026 length:3255 start_codon:yes stop_codon:yes gene_type:complete
VGDRISKRFDLKKIIVIGSGPIIIGQAAEFDYSGSQACKSLREEGYEVVLVNSNPATIQTDKEIADIIYIEPLTTEIIAEIIKKEKPDGLLGTMGGQTGLNLSTQLSDSGVLKEMGVEVIGTSIHSIKTAEDRDLFANLMRKIGEPIPEGCAVNNIKDAIKVANKIGFPVIVRPAYTLGGTGGGVGRNEDELIIVAKKGLEASMVQQVLIEKSLFGWYEYEYEVIRDSKDNCITICNMENLDAMGVHTGESIVVAPAQTLSDEEHQILRSAAIKIVRALKIEGGCNIQFAVNPKKWEYYVIEVNPRVSRSSALASKATGYPIAKISAKIAVNLTLDEISNDITKETPASFEPSMDYIVTKIPRWPFDKFRNAEKEIGTQMKSTGEVMAIGRTFEESLQKAIRSLDVRRFGLCGDGRSECNNKEEIIKNLSHPTDKRIFYINDALSIGMSVTEINRITGINTFFLEKIKNIHDFIFQLNDCRFEEINPKILIRAKKLGFSDAQLSHIFKIKENKIRDFRCKFAKPTYKMVDTCAAEFQASTPYYYSSYETSDEVNVEDRKKVVIIGGGPIRIAQGIEFDYCCVHGVLALQEEGIEAVIVNNNPETVSTDYDTSDKLYFEPITFEDVMNIVDKEDPYGVIVQFGGQTSLNLAVSLSKKGVRILGTSPENIDRAEDRKKFTRVLDKLEIPQAAYGTGFSVDEARDIANKIGYPVLVRPSYILGGRAMEVVYDEIQLKEYMTEAIDVSDEHPVLVDKFLKGAIEVDVDAVSGNGDVFIGGIMEHIEHAGIHSGDSACVLPPQTLSRDVISKIKNLTIKIANELDVIGLLNIQFAVKDDIVYVLEANPRASRTIPFVSKAIGVPLAKIATKVMLGLSLKDLGYIGERKINHVAVKEAVFPFVKLPGVDPVLGPEMKSTGEVMGIDFDFGKAYYKAELAAGNCLPTNGKIFISVQRTDAIKITSIAKRLYELGFQILATEGTMEVLKGAGVPAKEIMKVSEGSPNILDIMKDKGVKLIINTPTAGKIPYTDGFYIRRYAVDLRIPYITTITGAEAAVKAIESILKGEVTIRSLSDYYVGHVHEPRLEDFI